jgi:hypothetical protein
MLRLLNDVLNRAMVQKLAMEDLSQLLVLPPLYLALSLTDIKLNQHASGRLSWRSGSELPEPFINLCFCLSDSTINFSATRIIRPIFYWRRNEKMPLQLTGL